MVNSQAGNLRIRYLLGVLVVLVITDGIISYFFIRSGLGYEANPFLRSLIEESMFIPIKVFGAVLSAFILWDIHKHWAKLALVATSGLVAIYSGIVIWNITLFVVLARSYQ